MAIGFRPCSRHASASPRASPEARARALAQALFRAEWQKLTRLGYSSHIADQAVWDLLAWYFEDVAQNTRSPLRWTGFAGARRSR